jgi:hypothetical protein
MRRHAARPILAGFGLAGFGLASLGLARKESVDGA